MILNLTSGITTKVLNGSNIQQQISLVSVPQATLTLISSITKTLVLNSKLDLE